MSWNTHLSLTPDPPRAGSITAACGVEVKDAEPRFDEEADHLRICPKCKAIAQPVSVGGVEYFTFLIPGQQARDAEAA